MKRRTFLGALCALPAAPLVAKLPALDVPPVEAAGVPLGEIVEDLFRRAGCPLALDASALTETVHGFSALEFAPFFSTIETLRREHFFDVWITDGQLVAVKRESRAGGESSLPANDAPLIRGVMAPGRVGR